MTQSHRLPQGGLVDRTRPLRFEFDGAAYQGYAGDTLASALLANGIHLVGRSFKYHRPRGIHGAGTEEPNALVQLARGARTEPNVRATTLELYDGLVAASQNRWPSLRFDIGAINNALAPLFPAGFYYKTFMWPPTPRWWLRYEHVIRRAAGMGRAAIEPDPDDYEHQYVHCDVLVVGGGAAGLAAARSAAAAGARVIVCDENARWGGELPDSAATVDSRPAIDWMSTAATELAQQPNVRMLARTTAFGYYDDNLVGAIERVTDHLPTPPLHAPRQRLWKIRARAVVLATGAIERAIAYADNDLPGTLLAGAARIYVRRFGVRPCSRAVVFTNNDSAYATALDLQQAGVTVAAIVDARSATQLNCALPRGARAATLPIIAGSAIVGAHGRQHVASVDVASLSGGAIKRIACDLVCVSGGFNPVVHLFSQARGKLRYDDALATFVPGASPMPVFPAGAANGRFDLAGALSEGHAAGTAAAAHAGLAATASAAPCAEASEMTSLRPLWTVPARSERAKRFVDLQNDVTVNDIALAAREGYQAVEHLKRYTTLGMGTDQGKTSNIMGLALMAEQLGVPIPAVGTTTFRPPYAPVTMAAVPGQATGDHLEPTRYTAMHRWHAAHGARLVDAGLWKRPHSYPRSGESESEAASREARNVRSRVGVVDVSPLGKIELQGRDVAEFLNRIYVNDWDTLAVGRCQYGVMLRDDGMVMDDGTTARLGPTRYLMTTTIGGAAKVMQQIEYLLQAEWPELDVYAASVTEQWAAAAISGPQARQVVAALVDIDVSNAAFPIHACGHCNVHAADRSIAARLFRTSSSGELGFEIHVRADRGQATWDAIIAAGEPFGLMPYGTAAMGTLRIEKGQFAIGAEADGRTTAADLGLGEVVSAAKWCVGKPLLARPAMTDANRWQLVGLTAQDGGTLPRAAKIVAEPDRPAPNPMLGHVTSMCFSPHLNAWIALALVAEGRSRHGETLWAVSPLAGARARVQLGAPCFIDPEGERLRV